MILKERNTSQNLEKQDKTKQKPSTKKLSKSVVTFTCCNTYKSKLAPTYCFRHFFPSLLFLHLAFSSFIFILFPPLLVLLFSRFTRHLPEDKRIRQVRAGIFFYVGNKLFRCNYLPRRLSSFQLEHHRLTSLSKCIASSTAHFTTLCIPDLEWW